MARIHLALKYSDGNTSTVISDGDMVFPVGSEDAGWADITDCPFTGECEDCQGALVCPESRDPERFLWAIRQLIRDAEFWASPEGRKPRSGAVARLKRAVTNLQSIHQADS